jgi:predicted DNA-binding transcriptional regulator AlpA
MTIETLDQSSNTRGDTEHDSRLDELPVLITIARVATLLGISRSAAYRCAANGDLPTTHLGGRVYVVTARLRSLLEQQ